MCLCSYNEEVNYERNVRELGTSEVR